MSDTIPQHIAIIMDGNGRWAKARKQIRSEGHLAGTQTIETIIEAAAQAGVKYLTVYAFSTENWKRPLAEVNFLMKLIPRFCQSKLDSLKKNGVRIRAIGRIHELPDAARNALLKTIDETAANDRITLTLAINYGGRAEIVDAVNTILKNPPENGSVTEQSFASYLYAPDIPEPDLLIRTGGEKRLSNFLLWELSYAELYVTDTLWPDFDGNALQKALDDFATRQRRFGEVK